MNCRSPFTFPVRNTALIPLLVAPLLPVSAAQQWPESCFSRLKKSYTTA